MVKYHAGTKLGVAGSVIGTETQAKPGFSFCRAINIMAMQHIVCLPIIEETDNWYVVKVVSASPSAISKMTNWCREYPGSRFSYYFRHPALSKIRHHQYGEFYFEDERDAMMFTLTWV